jgi:hypothetical protein
MEEKTVQRLLFTTQWTRLFGRPRQGWQISTSYIRCDVADGIDLAQHAFRTRMDIYFLCDVEASVFVRQLCALQDGNAVGWMTKESSINF